MHVFTGWTSGKRSCGAETIPRHPGDHLGSISRAHTSQIPILKFRIFLIFANLRSKVVLDERVPGRARAPNFFLGCLLGMCIAENFLWVPGLSEQNAYRPSNSSHERYKYIYVYISGSYFFFDLVSLSAVIVKRLRREK